ncbi:hypothetical protein EW026_g5214 [Hermanssonia centrifuga]|uniref:Origin recognition complex subunit 1 n=1 Tax=Hermanssonia centrifuga TaxID=98765 RepID=A0A4S4KJ53_9APHY|nr:hypothetical protein EW026_g5214 [Hermanssonia centrifuga]
MALRRSKRGQPLLDSSQSESTAIHTATTLYARPAQPLDILDSQLDVLQGHVSDSNLQVEHLETRFYDSFRRQGNGVIKRASKVYGRGKETSSFTCISAINSRRGLYYIFDYPALLRSLPPPTDPSHWDAEARNGIWDLVPEDIVLDESVPSTPLKTPKSKGRKRKSPAVADHEEEEETPRAAKRAKTDKAKRPKGDESSTEDDDDDYTHEPVDDEELELGLDDEADSSEDEALSSQPRTPSRKNRSRSHIPQTPRTQRRTPSKAKTPRKKANIAAPTPHSKAALRARARANARTAADTAPTPTPTPTRQPRTPRKKRTIAVRTPGLYADQIVLSGEGGGEEKDPWLRAMHVLHVASRPEALACRDEEYQKVVRAVGELLEDGSGGCVYISGVPGTGKTATVHAVVRELKRMAEQNVSEILPPPSLLSKEKKPSNGDQQESNPFTYVEINGLRIPEPSAAYSLLWEAVSGHDVQREGHLKMGAKEALKRLERYFGSGGGEAGPGGHACVVLMDELDQLMTTKQDVVYNFFNWPTLVGSKLVVLAVANTMDLPERVMTGRVRSRLGMVRINFQPYSTPQLEQIVKSRLLSAKEGVSEGSAPDVIAPDGIKFAAMKVSSISGDARRVLDICRRAVELVQPYSRTARTDDVKQVIKDMQNSPIAAYLRELSFHERIMLAALLRCIRKEGVEEIKWGDIQRQHLLYIPILADDEDPNRRPTPGELTVVLDSLSASRAVLCEDGTLALRKPEDERRVVLNLEHSEVERELAEVGGQRWKNVLNI